MNKESRMYIRNVMKGRSFVIDFINTALSVGILIMVVLNSVGPATGLYFVQIFAFGALLAFLNCIKKLRARSGFFVAFAVFGVLMIVMAVLCYLKI
ncbi:MAG: hypothetical protein K6F34_09125 [Lachnospiraceae bacterium]|nr:hypothetical protein [Lachnospiraceae bacterium]